MLFGSIYISPSLIQACAASGIVLVLLDRSGRFQARIEGPVSGNVLLRRAQYKQSDEEPEGIIRSILIGKIANQRSVLQRAKRDYGDQLESSCRATLSNVTNRLAQIVRRIGVGHDSIDRLRGLEGEAASLYFSVFGHLIRAPEPQMEFTGRSRRPPRDPMNALLSFLYTLLVHDCRSAAESVGLDPAVGFFHRDRPGRPSLALDLMEELRPVFADRLALSLVNRQQLRAKDFQSREGGSFVMSDDARKQVLDAWQKRKRVTRRHPFIGEQVPLGLVVFLQAQLLSRHLRRDLDAHPPWLWK